MSTPTYNRLENRTRSEDFSKSLRAEVRDPLWMLSRQWQMGEFRAENTGSPIKSRVHAQIHPVQRYMAKANGKVKEIGPQQPLEVFVERESIPMDLLMRAEMGRHFRRILARAINDETMLEQVLNRLLTVIAPVSLRLELPAKGPGARHLFANRKLRQVASLLARGRTLDGGALFQYLTADPGHGFSDFFDPQNLPTSAASVDALGEEFLAWFRRTYSQPEEEREDSYRAERGEYEFYLGATDPAGNTYALHAPQYHQGSLDWYAFDQVGDPTGEAADLVASGAASGKAHVATMLPTVARFAGMPHSRWWQFEDGRVNLQVPRGGALNPAEIVFNDFALHFSNDWMIFPLTVPFGHLCELEKIVVTDVFGQRSKVLLAGHSSTNDYERWDLFSLKKRGGSGHDYRLFVPPVVDRIQEGKPFEAVHLMRDEMANMVWAIEQTIGDGMGQGTDGYESGEAVRKYLESLLPPAPAREENATPDNAMRYKLATPVPENWIPFVPVRVANDQREIQLQRSSMPREVQGQVVGRVTPRTGIVSLPPSPFHFHEEEVPRAGAILTRSWQRSRWYNGKTYTWVGRRKQTGRGEAASGLEFDSVEKK